MSGKSDTHPTMEAALIKGYRQMSSAQKLKMALEMSETIRTLAKAGILAVLLNSDPAPLAGFF